MTDRITDDRLAETSARFASASSRFKGYAEAPDVIYTVPGAIDRLAVARDDVLMAQYRLAEAAGIIDALRLERQPTQAIVEGLRAERDEARHEVWNLGLAVGVIAKWPRESFSRVYAEEWAIRTARILTRWGQVGLALDVLKVTSSGTKPNKRLEAEVRALATPEQPEKPGEDGR